MPSIFDSLTLIDRGGDVRRARKKILHARRRIQDDAEFDAINLAQRTP
jgi:hypothetical protein